MKVLVTGATGFVGQHIVPLLLECGYDVIAVARDEKKARTFTWFNAVQFVFCDIHDGNVKTLFQFGKPDAVIHLAWSNLPNYKSTSHVEYTLPADFHFLKLLVENGVNHLLVTGTCFEYGMVNGALSEQLPGNPSTPYAIAKNALRLMLEQLQENSAFKLQWARLFYTFGRGQNPNSLLAQLDRAIDNRDSTFNMSGGEQLRDYLPIEAVARKLLAVFESPDFQGVINICSGEPISVRRLVEEHLKKRAASIHLNLGYYEYPDYEPMAFWGDNALFEKVTNRG